MMTVLLLLLLLSLLLLSGVATVAEDGKNATTTNNAIAYNNATAIATTTNNNNNDTILPVDDDDDDDDDEGDHRSAYATVWEALDPVLPPSTRARLAVPGTCQHWALHWILLGNDDGYYNNNNNNNNGNENVAASSSGSFINATDLSASRIRQRYAVAVLYCEWHGHHPHYNDDDDDGNHKWTLSPTVHECDWPQSDGYHPCGGAARSYRRIVQAGRQATGTLPAELALLADSLRRLDVSDNLLTGTIPDDLARLTNLVTLRLAGNLWEAGSVPEAARQLLAAGRLVELDLSDGYWTGELPRGDDDDDDRWPFLQRLDLSNNDLAGRVDNPWRLGDRLQIVKLYDNANLTGDWNGWCDAADDDDDDMVVQVDQDGIACDCCADPPFRHVDDDDNPPRRPPPAAARLGIAGWYRTCPPFDKDRSSCRLRDHRDATAAAAAMDEEEEERDYFRGVRSVVRLDVTGRMLCYVNPADSRHDNYVHWLGPSANGSNDANALDVYTLIQPAHIFGIANGMTTLMDCTPDGVCDCSGIDSLRQGWQTSSSSSSTDDWCPTDHVCDRRPFVREASLCDLNMQVAYNDTRQDICPLNAALKRAHKPATMESARDFVAPYTVPSPPNTAAFESKTELQAALGEFMNGNLVPVTKAYGPIRHWNVAKLDDFSDLFEPFTKWIHEADYNPDLDLYSLAIHWFNEPLDWDFSKAKDLSRMFQYTQWDQPINHWNVSSVTSMRGLFANSVVQEDVDNWDTKSVTDMSYIFHDSEFSRELLSWDTRSVTNMSHAFAGANRFNQDLSSWDVSSVVDMSGMFAGAESFNQDLSCWVLSSIQTMDGMFAKDPLGRTTEAYGRSLCAWGSTLSPTASVVGLFSENHPKCPAWQDPDLSASPPGPFCYPCNETNSETANNCATKSPSGTPTTSAPTPDETLAPASPGPTPGTNGQTTPQPTPAKTPQSTLAPTNSTTVAGNNAKSFAFSNIRMRIYGAKRFDREMGQAFVASLRQYYMSYYKRNNSGNNERLLLALRQLLGTDILLVDTRANIVDDVVDDTGNNVRYDQTLTLERVDGKEADEDLARQVLLEPLQTQALREDYLSVLRDQGPAFENVTGVNAPRVPAGVNDDGDDDRDGGGNEEPILLIAVITGGVVICFGLLTWLGNWLRIRRKARQASKSVNGGGDHSHNSNGQYHMPEGPVDRVYSPYQSGRSMVPSYASSSGALVPYGGPSQRFVDEPLRAPSGGFSYAPNSNGHGHYWDDDGIRVS